MAIEDAARANREELFGGQPSSLAETDPELTAYFDNWAYGEVVRDAAELDAGLDLRTRLLVQLATIAAAGGVEQFRVLAGAAVDRGGVSPVELREVVYQAVAYLGMGRAYDFLHAANDVLRAAGVELPIAGQAASDPQDRHEVGRAVQAKLVGAATVATMHANARDDAKHFQRYLTGNCFGDVVARHGLDLATRELLTFAMLAGRGGVDAQLRGHVSVNLNVGNNRARLMAVLTVISPYIGYPSTLNALAAINDLAP